MIPIYLFNASPWGSLTKGYRLLNPLSQREMREKNPYNIQRWRALLSSCIIHAPWSLSTANARIQQTCVHIFRGRRRFFLAFKTAIMQSNLHGCRFDVSCFNFRHTICYFGVLFCFIFYSVFLHDHVPCWTEFVSVFFVNI